MKWLFGICLAGWACICGAVTPACDLTETNQTVVSGAIKGYVPKTGVVKIRTSEGLVQRSYGAFESASQETVDAWFSDYNFMRKSQLKATLTYKNTETITTNIPGTYRTYDGHAFVETNAVIGKVSYQHGTYQVKLVNTSEADFDGLELSYRLFFNQSLLTELTGYYQLAGKFEAFDLPANSTHELTCKEIEHGVVYKSADHIFWKGKPRNLFIHREGVLLTLRKKGGQGEWLEREIIDGKIPARRKRTEYQKLYDWPLIKRLMPEEEEELRKEKEEEARRKLAEAKKALEEAKKELGEGGEDPADKPDDKKTTSS